jgi:hypothetical protein
MVSEKIVSFASDRVVIVIMPPLPFAISLSVVMAM